MIKVSLRDAVLADESILLEFEQKVLEAERPFNSSIKSHGAAYYDLTELRTSDNSRLIVAEVDGAIIGSGYARIRISEQALIHESHSYLGFMFVVPEYRGCGVNKVIIDDLLEWSQNKGVSDCYLDVYHGNEAAIRAYEKVGFEKSKVEMKLSLK